MLSKKHNDPFYWKNKLEALNSLPEQSATEKDAMWEKLHNRLEEKPTASKANWYWMAAGLLPLIIIVLTMVNNSKHTLARQASQEVKNADPTIIYLPPASKEAVTLSVSAPVEKKQLTGIEIKTKSKIPADTTKINETITDVNPLPEKPAAETATNSILPADTTVTFATNAVAKKKLPVVHINELETFPPEFSAPVNYVQNIKIRKNKINNQSVVTQQNIIGFKIKLSSKN